ncbi:MAG: alpha/beta fold hydrolase [Gammaproteobacteria bacterium]
MSKDPRPASIRFCKAADGVRIAYATAGNGPPMVKAPNWMNHLEYDWDSIVWRPWLLEMVKQHSLTSYDSRGCGLSDREVSDLSLEAHLADLEAVTDAAGAKRFALLGMSQGAAISIAYAERHPERVTHLILYGAYARGALRRGEHPKLLEEAHLMRKLIELGWGKEDSAFRQVFTSQFIPDCTPDQVRCFNELQRMTTTPEIAVRLLSMFQEIDVSALAPKIRCPTLVLHSRGDLRAPFEEGRAVAGLIPGAEFVPLESRNHILLEHEQAWSRFFSEISRFIVQHGGEAGSRDRHFLELTGREREVLELIAQGLDNTQIASALALSPKTVRNHINSIFSKLRVPNRAQAIVSARDAGFGQAAGPTLAS